jgi:quercetin dioxygenase-like cupin family protein
MATIFQDVQRMAGVNARELWYLGNRMKIHVDSADTNGQFALIETTIFPGSEPPMHMHTNEDETFLVLEGRLKLIVDGLEYVLNEGESKFAPRGIPHTFQILTPVARTMGVITPGGFEDFFRMLGEPAADGRPADPRLYPSRERVGEIARNFGVKLV